MTVLSIVLPTIKGREKDFSRTLAAYAERTPGVEIEWLLEFDHPTVASAWNAGAAKATGEILHLGNDDLEPEEARWFQCASVALDAGFTPVGWIREDVAGRFGRDFPRIPICKREWWTVPLTPELHYYADNQFGDRMRVAGHPVIATDGYDFYHRRSMVGRDETPERVERDRSTYVASL